MIKIPVTRFSAPNSKKEGLYWYELLSSLYCAFTIVRADGTIMGCVDLPPRFAKPNKSHRMRAAVLKQCGIPYIVLQQGMLPTMEQIRRHFLGDASAMPQSTHQAAAIEAASSHLRSSISRSRKTRHVPSVQTGPNHVDSSFDPDSHFSVGSSSGQRSPLSTKTGQAPFAGRLLRLLQRRIRKILTTQEGEPQCGPSCSGCVPEGFTGILKQ
eukprot:gene52540-70246_t